MIKLALFPFAIAFLFSGLFPATAKASNISTVSFAYASGTQDPEVYGTTTEGYGVFSFPTGLTNVTASDVSNFTFVQYFDLDNCTGDGCFELPSGMKYPNFVVSYTLSDLALTLDGSGNIATFGVDATSSFPDNNFFFAAYYSENPITSYPGYGYLGYSDGFGYVYGSITDISLTSTPEPASIGLFAVGLILAGLAVKRHTH